MKAPAPVLEACTALLRPSNPSLTVDQLTAILASGGMKPLEKSAVTIAEAASILGVKPRTVVNYFHRGWLKRIPLGKRLARVSVAEVNQLLSNGIRE